MQNFDPLKTLNTYITPEGKINIFGGQKEGFDPLKTLNTYITPEGKINIFGGQKEGFDPGILPDKLYNVQMEELKLGNVQDMKTFVRNLDTPIKDMTVDTLTNRIQILTAVKSWLSSREQKIKDELRQEEQRTINISSDQLGKLVFNNINSIFIFIYRVIDLVISHSEELKRQLASGGNVEFFTITPIVLQMPDGPKNDFNKFVSRYGLTFDDVIDFINNAELPAKELNSKGKILRLRVLSLFRQILSIAIGGDIFIKLNLTMREAPPEAINTSVQIAQLLHNVACYVIDLHLKELYDTMSPAEIRIGNYFEKFIKYYLTENEAVKELSKTRVTLTDLQKQIDSIKVDAEKRVTDAKAGVNKMIEDANAESNKKIEDSKTIQMGLIGGNVLMLLLCCIMTVMYFRK
jgi:hypothetical protein